MASENSSSGTPPSLVVDPSISPPTPHDENNGMNPSPTLARKLRNRAAQAAFRTRRTSYINTLEATVRTQASKLRGAGQLNARAAEECLMLRYRCSLLERVLREKGVDVDREISAKTWQPVDDTPKSSTSTSTSGTGKDTSGGGSGSRKRKSRPSILDSTPSELDLATTTFEDPILALQPPLLPLPPPPPQPSTAPAKKRKLTNVDGGLGISLGKYPRLFLLLSCVRFERTMVLD